MDHLRIVEHLRTGQYRPGRHTVLGECLDRLPGGHLSEAGQDRGLRLGGRVAVAGEEAWVAEVLVGEEIVALERPPHPFEL